MTLPFIILKKDKAENKISKKDSAFLCNFNSSTKHIHSSRRDVVLLYATNFGPGLELAIKSLRSTGSRCRIILLCPRNMNINRYYKKLIDALRVEIVFNKDTSNRSDVPHMIRYEFEQQWIRKHIDEIDRVFHTDSFDVYFQGDPFSGATGVTKNELTFVVEPHLIRSCGWNTYWLAQCYKEPVLNNMRHEYIVCSGSIAGGAKLYLDLLDMMISSAEWKRCWMPSLDQSILNFAIWNGNITDNNIPYRFTGCDGGFFTVQWCVLEKNILYNEHNQVISISGSVPAYIHQYNRIPSFTKDLYKKCKVLNR